MYDPARDIFTSSEDAAAEGTDLGDRRDSHASNSQDMKLWSPEKGEGSTMDGGDAVKTLRSNQTRENGNDVASHLLAVTYIPGNPIPQPVSSSNNRQPSETSEKAEKRARSPHSFSVMDTNSSPSSASKKRKLEHDQSVQPSDAAVAAKKLRTASGNGPTRSYDSPVPMTTANLPRFSRKKSGPDSEKPSKRTQSPSRDHQSRRDRSRSPKSSRRSRSPGHRSPNRQRRERRSPPRRRSPTPPPRSPPRKLKRPGGASRIGVAEKEALRQRQLERDQEQLHKAKVDAATRGVHDVVRQHYNAVPERGRDWRKTDSRIKGLRSFNNWIKSTIIQKFSPNEDFTPGGSENTRFASGMEGGGLDGEDRRKGLLVLDVGCGKGGDLGKWQQAPQPVDLYVGVDPAEISIDQARDRYMQMKSGGGGGGRGGRGNRGGFRGGRPQRVFQGEFFAKDAFGEWLGDIPIVAEVGIDGSVGPGGGGVSARWGGGGFDVVSMMFCMHYAFESEAKARGMLRNVAGSLKKGGRFLGVIPNSDVLSAKVEQFHQNNPNKISNGTSAEHHVENSTEQFDSKEEKEEGEAETEAETVPEWGNSIYRVRFPGKPTPHDGIFRPPFGWKYSYFMEEAVEEIPEYVVPWEAFRAIAEDYNLELQYRKPFDTIWREESDDPILGPLSERMGVRERGRGPLLVSDAEMEAASFYHAFCFYKV